MKLYVFFAKILFVFTPLLYYLRGLYQIPLLNNIKDFIIILLGTISIVIAVKKRLLTKEFSFLLFIYFFIIINSLIQLEDIFFYLISLRELIVYPFFYILIGVVLYDKIDFNKYIYYGSVLCLVLMYIFLIFYPNLSYGTTFRFKAFFDREHLPAIFASISFIYVLYYSKNLLIKSTVLILSLIIIALTGTRSVLLALLIVYVVYYLKFSLKNIITLLLLGVISFFVINTLFTRDIYYNLKGRTTQYDLAKLSIEDNFFSGIGIDKYGVLGDKTKEYHFKGHSTTTMDSSFIKYFVNLGVPLAFIYLAYIFFLIFRKRYDDDAKNILIKRLLILTFLMGTVTGKFGAYPLNLIFFINLMTFSKAKNINILKNNPPLIK